MNEENKEINYFDIFDNEYHQTTDEQTYLDDFETIKYYAQKAEEIVSYEKDNSDLIRNCTTDEIKLKIKALLSDLLSQRIANRFAIEADDKVYNLDECFSNLLVKHLGIYDKRNISQAADTYFEEVEKSEEQKNR